jgi:hypothetical protein
LTIERAARRLSAVRWSVANNIVVAQVITIPASGDRRWLSENVGA